MADASRRVDSFSNFFWYFSNSNIIYKTQVVRVSYFISTFLIFIMCVHIHLLFIFSILFCWNNNFLFVYRDDQIALVVSINYSYSDREFLLYTVENFYFWNSVKKISWQSVSWKFTLSVKMKYLFIDTW